MKENWKIGLHPSTVVSDMKVSNTNFPVPPNKAESEDEDIEYYGGYLICESIGDIKHTKLISSAPDLLEALERTLKIAIQYGIHEDHPEFIRARNVIKKATE